MGSIQAYESATGLRYRIQYRDADHRARTHTGFKTQREAKDTLRRLEIAVTDGQHVEVAKSRTTIGELSAAWLLAKERTTKPSAYRALESAWRIHVAPKWADRSVATVKATEVRDWLAALRLTRSATTVLRVHGVLAGILDDAVADRRLLSNPSRDKRTVTRSLPKKRRTPNVYLTHAQVELLAGSARYPTLVRFLAYTGLRWGEATGLRVRHVDTLRRRVTVEENAVLVNTTVIIGTPKDNETRSVPYPAFLSTPLARLCEGKAREDLLFGDGNSHMRIPKSGGGWFEKAVEQAQSVDPAFPRVTPHDLRHTAASLAISTGANVKAIQRMLGHASAAMTLDVYADLFDDDLDAVAAALNQAHDDSIVVKSVVKLSSNASGEGRDPSVFKGSRPNN
ncbi:site-specific integrase [Planctomonas sp. JC2975]|uniref:tyrosine-type recombinase/integrase n=1 Tax=Planctomonas sp. JC2975 TaxID=2729626 RepID=UPI00147619C1|nr:site-specific integrase [Planctomonas sp. JC2975]NNC12828.1 site-specific integrase [Planctomonas sp. JC2975]